MGSTWHLFLDGASRISVERERVHLNTEKELDGMICLLGRTVRTKPGVRFSATGMKST